MSRKLLTSLLLVVGVVCSSIADTDSVVMLRLVGAMTHKPLKGISIGLSVLNDKSQRTAFLNAKTNSDGVAFFRLKDPVSQRIEIMFAPDDLSLCSNIQFSVAEILSTGVVDQNKCGTEHSKYSGVARPGELVVFGKKVSIWQRLRREIP
jgi:hypothetical protein